MTARFDGQVAIVTGASGGMGRAIALAFAAAGASVVAADLTEDAGRETVEQIGQAGAAHEERDDRNTTDGTVDDGHDAGRDHIRDGGRRSY